MKFRLLVVDDSATIQKIVSMAFENEDMIVHGVDNGKEALRKIAQFQPDIVISDVDMPGMTGFDLSKEIKQSSQFHSIPVLLLKSEFEDFNETLFEESQADDYISKPFKLEAIVEKVKQLLDQTPSSETAEEDAALFFEDGPAEAQDDDAGSNRENAPIKLSAADLIEETDLPPPGNNEEETQTASLKLSIDDLVEEIKDAAEEPADENLRDVTGESVLLEPAAAENKEPETAPAPSETPVPEAAANDDATQAREEPNLETGDKSVEEPLNSEDDKIEAPAAMGFSFDDLIEETENAAMDTTGENLLDDIIKESILSEPVAAENKEPETAPAPPETPAPEATAGDDVAQTREEPNMETDDKSIEEPPDSAAGLSEKTEILGTIEFSMNELADELENAAMDAADENLIDDAIEETILPEPEVAESEEPEAAPTMLDAPTPETATNDDATQAREEPNLETDDKSIEELLNSANKLLNDHYDGKLETTVVADDDEPDEPLKTPEEAGPPVKNASEEPDAKSEVAAEQTGEMNLEELLSSANGILKDDFREQARVDEDRDSQKPEVPQEAETSAFHPGESVTNPLVETIAAADAVEAPGPADGLADIDPSNQDSADELAAAFHAIQKGEDITQAEPEEAHDRAEPEPETRFEEPAPAVVAAAETHQEKPDLIEETLSYLAELAPATATKEIEQVLEPKMDPQRKPSMSAEPKGEIFAQIVGEHIKQTLERSLKESIAKEISGLSQTIERSVEEIVREVAPDIARSIIQEEIEKIKKLEKT
ncbi:MAG: response regulator [Nitrospinales bacterium]